MKKITFGCGCFWCTDAIFQKIDGVIDLKVGYSGGKTDNPTYEEVCSGKTNHAEVTQITYDEKKLPFDKLLEIFWKIHDPTTINRQGDDIGSQYRSVIFYHDDEQKIKALEYKAKLNNKKIWDKPIVTEITKFEKFFEAEDYHQNYYNQNPNNTYCQFVVTPKIKKFEEIFMNK